MPRTDINACDIDLTAIMDAHDVLSIRRIETVDGRFFKVTLAAGEGLGMTVGQAFANAQRQPMQVAA